MICLLGCHSCRTIQGFAMGKCPIKGFLKKGLTINLHISMQPAQFNCLIILYITFVLFLIFVDKYKSREGPLIDLIIEPKIKDSSTN